MRLKDWKAIAEQQCYRYRDNRAYVQGVLDAGKREGDNLARAARWVLAVQYAKEYLERYDPNKARFFNRLFGLDRPLRRRSAEKTITALSFELYVDRSTLYKWKSEALTLVLIGAAQTGALRPYGIEGSEPSVNAVCNRLTD